jgi:transcriptional antiterminator RfaH
MSYLTTAQLENNRVSLALHCLKLSGYRVYAPRLRTYRVSHGGRRVEERPLLFPSYAFVLVVTGWWQARWAPGVIRLIMAGDATPAAVPEAVIEDLKGRETDGLINLPPAPKFRPGDRLRVVSGPFAGHVGLYAGMKPRERVEVLLAILGPRRG